ncbi:hypothetical protein CPJCM30710_03150 [Clostridium polyendosporum]|uniref:Thioredoxin domain-containing protein n=1 Tax=Clostridium polyendosporum TaxID=69208 RepID=A0A919RXM3_9CLOT|nr:TlpA disulfide reductase family protein [Clostridium polyendosporum]GIM27649.1 hypothetical protein CPJCM30710_03150 [Clostridium polyendosporum]
MKKFIFPILAVLLFSISMYTVINFNKDNSNTNSNSSTQATINNEDTVKNSQSSTTSEKVSALDFRLKDLNGKEVSLNDFKGKKVFLNFWATWCPPCRAEMPDIEKLYQETKDSDLVILAVNIGEDNNTVKSFIDKNTYNFRVLLDTDQSVASKYDIVSIPTSFFIDKEGYIIAKKIGAMSLEEMKSYVNIK